MKLNSRLYKQKCSVGVARSAITRANVIDLIMELVADADEEASPNPGCKLLICWDYAECVSRQWCCFVLLFWLLPQTVALSRD